MGGIIVGSDGYNCWKQWVGVKKKVWVAREATGKNCLLVKFFFRSIRRRTQKKVHVARLIAGWPKRALVAGGSGGNSVGNSGCD